MTNTKQSPKYPVIKGEFAPRLRKLREAADLKPKDMLTILGVDRKTYASWETAKSTALPRDMNTLLLLCETIHTTPLYLLTGLFGEQKEERHAKAYLDLYDRYKNDEDFRFMVMILKRANKHVLKALCRLSETVDDAYRGLDRLYDD